MINENKRNIQRDALRAFSENDFNGYALIPTGVGKAYVLIQILKHLKPKSCWYLVDSEGNRDVTFKKEMIKWGAEEWIDRIEFMCYQTAYKLKGFHVDLLLADEADFSFSPKYSEVYFNNKFKHKVLVSGTLNGDKYKYLEKMMLPVVYDKGLTEAEDEGALNKTDYYSVNYKLNHVENKKYLGYNRIFAKLLHGNYSRKQLENLQIARKHFLSGLKSSVNVCRRLMKHLYEKDGKHKILIFCNLSEQADLVCKYSYHSKNDGKYFKEFDEGNLRALSLVAKADRGRNINGVNVIIFEAPTKSSTKFFQRTGRGRRLLSHEKLDVYFLIPYYVDRRGKTKPTIVRDWIFKAATKIKDFKPRDYHF